MQSKKNTYFSEEGECNGCMSVCARHWTDGIQQFNSTGEETIFQSCGAWNNQPIMPSRAQQLDEVVRRVGRAPVLLHDGGQWCFEPS